MFPTVRTTFALALGALVLLAAAPSGAQQAVPPAELPPLPEVSADYTKAMKAYLTSQGQFAQIGESVAFQVANETLMMLAQSGMQVTEQVQAIVLEEARSAYQGKFSDLDFLASIWAPVYAQHFSIEELQAVTKWFESPLGKRVVAHSPDINGRGMAEIQKASIAVAPEFQLAVDARFREAGLVQDPAAAP